MKRVFLLYLILTLPVAGLFADKTTYPTLRPGETARGRMRLQAGGGISYTTFVVDVPVDAIAMELRIQGAQADLDLFAKHGSEIDDYVYVDASGITDDNNEVLRLSRTSPIPLKAGEGTLPGY